MSRTQKFILILILILAGFLRFYQITTTPPGLYPDEAMNGNNALEVLQTKEFKAYYPENNGREGLFINIQAAFLDFFNANEPWVLRLPSAIFGMLTVLGIFFLARELFSTNIALLSSFFLATSVWHIIFSRIGFRALLAPFFLVWAIYFILRAFREKNSTFYFLLSIFSGALFGAGLYTYIAYRITPLLILLLIGWLWWLDKENRKQMLLSTFYFLLSAIVISLPLGIHYLQNPGDFLGRTAQVSVFSSPAPLAVLGQNIIKTAGMFHIEGDQNWRHNYAGAPQLFWPVGIFFLIGIFMGMKKLFRQNPNDKVQISNNPPAGGQSLKLKGNSFWILKLRHWFDIWHLNFGFLFLFAWLFLAALPVMISNEGIPHALRAILMLPPVIIFAAVGGIATYYVVMRAAPKISRIASVIVIVIVIVHAYYTYFHRWANNPNVQSAFNAQYVTIGREINRLPKETPKYVIVEAGGVDVRGIPMPAQTVMFITDSFTSSKQLEKNIFYVLPKDRATIPANASVFTIR